MPGEHKIVFGRASSQGRLPGACPQAELHVGAPAQRAAGTAMQEEEGEASRPRKKAGPVAPAELWVGLLSFS